MMINYAHRGASSYAPENTLASFYLGWQMGANGIETDVQRTKDGVIVLFHDDDLRRIVGLEQSISKLTYAELLKLDFGIHKSEKFAGERIPTLEELMRHFGGKGLHFAIELKQEGIERETLEIIDRYCDRDHVIITSGMWHALVNMRSVDPDIQLGILIKDPVTQEVLDAARRDGIGQICPKASSLDAGHNKMMRDQGFSVRAWGIDNEETMHAMIDLGVDGMTINFPDVLTRALLNRANG